jgi:hypothetical protein
MVGDSARITLDAQTGVEQAQRRYLNFLPTSAIVVDPRGSQSTVALPQVAPGRYEAVVPVDDDGVYTVTVTQIDPPDTRAMLSSGFVVPYSREYRLTESNRNLLDALARRTGGRLITDPADAFAHTLPSVGAAQPLWPLLTALLALLVVADVGIRRVRISAPEVRAGYTALRRRLGYVDDYSGFVVKVPVRPARPRARTRVQPVTLVAVPDENGVVTTTAHQRSMLPDTHSSRLLAAKRRAARR